MYGTNNHLSVSPVSGMGFERVTCRCESVGTNADESLGYDSHSCTPELSPHYQRLTFARPTCDAGTQTTEEASPLMYERNARLLESDLADRDALLDQAVQWGKQQEWNANRMRECLRQLRGLHGRMLEEVSGQTNKVDALYYALSAQTADQVREEGLDAVMALRATLEKADNLSQIATGRAEASLITPTNAKDGPPRGFPLTLPSDEAPHEERQEALKRDRLLSGARSVFDADEEVSPRHAHVDREATCSVCPVM